MIQKISQNFVRLIVFILWGLTWFVLAIVLDNILSLLYAGYIFRFNTILQLNYFADFYLLIFCGLIVWLFIQFWLKPRTMRAVQQGLISRRWLRLTKRLSWFTPWLGLTYLLFSTWLWIINHMANIFLKHFDQYVVVMFILGGIAAQAVILSGRLIWHRYNNKHGKSPKALAPKNNEG